MTLLSAALCASASSAWSQEQDDDRQRQNQQQDDGQHRDRQNHRSHEQSGRPDHSQAGLGVVIEDADAGGVKVDRVVDNSPAHRAGLQQGDRILSVDGQEVDSPRQLSRLIAQQEPGRQVRIDFIRDGQRESIRANLVSRQRALPNDQEQASSSDPSQNWNDSRSRQEHIFDDRQGDRPLRENRYAWNTEQARFNHRYSYDQDANRANASDHSGDMNSRLARLESTVDRLSRQIGQLQNQLTGPGSAEYRTRSQQYESNPSQYDRNPWRQERYESDDDNR
jgi:serine protease Do